MKIVIAGAGRGTRFGELTKSCPKILLPVLGKPFLYYLLESIKQIPEAEVGLVAGHLWEQVRDYIVKNSLNIEIINQFAKLGEDKYGTACSLLAAAEFVKDDEFIFLYGDNLYSPQDIERLSKQTTGNYVSGYRYQGKGIEKYGQLDLAGDQLKQIAEKPASPISDIINSGLYRFTPEIFARARNVRKSSRGELELVDAVNILAKEERVKVFMLQKYFIDFGSPRDLPGVEKFITEYYGSN